MSLAATNLKDLFKLNIKHRHDSYSDQYHRVFMVKILLACTMVVGISWYTDKFNCIVPDFQSNSDEFAGFVSMTCWIQGLYIYEEMRPHIDLMSYYGIPKDPKLDGVGKGALCHTLTFEYKKGVGCDPMEKVFYLQYQYMPFFLCAIALLYYIPYMISKTINHDLINLREAIKKEEPEIDNIVRYYFKDRKNKSNPTILTVRQIINIGVKILYILINFVAFFGTDSVLMGKFASYGKNWMKWKDLNNTLEMNYLGTRKSPKPGNLLLPPFGYCDLFAQATDRITTISNKHRVLCEMSQHVLQQYVFIVLWFLFIIGMVVSIIGFFVLVINYIIGIVGIRRMSTNDSARKIFDSLTYREIEYLEYMRKKNIPVYGEVLDKLKEKILGSATHSIDSSFDSNPPKTSDNIPMYPMKRRPQDTNSGPYAL